MRACMCECVDVRMRACVRACVCVCVCVCALYQAGFLASYQSHNPQASCHLDELEAWHLDTWNVNRTRKERARVGHSCHVYCEIGISSKSENAHTGALRGMLSFVDSLQQEWDNTSPNREINVQIGVPPNRLRASIPRSALQTIVRLS